MTNDNTQKKDIEATVTVLIHLISGLGFHRVPPLHHPDGPVLIPLISGLGFHPDASLTAAPRALS